MKEYYRENRKAWWKALEKVFEEKALPDENVEWTEASRFPQVIRPLTRPSHLNHTFFPRGGGLDLSGILSASSFPGALELHFGSQFPSRNVSVVSGERLVFLGFAKYPHFSCFLLETSALPPQEVDTVDSWGQQEFVEVSKGLYAPRWHWDEGHYGYNEHGDPEALPEDARLISYYTRPGRFLIAAKGGPYNFVQGHYDGRHNDMTAAELRSYIQIHIDRVEEIALTSPTNWVDRLPKA